MSDYKEDVDINIHALDEELFKQASLFIKWAEKAVNATTIRDGIKNKLELVRGEVAIDIREHPDEYKFKITEETVKSLVETDSEVVKLKEELLQANEQVNIFTAARMAIEQKKTMLENIVRLYQTVYWGEMAVPNTDKITQNYDDKILNDKLNQNERMNRRIKNG